MFYNITPNSIESITKIKTDLIKCKYEYLSSTMEFIRPYVVVYLDQLFRNNKLSKDIKFLPIARKTHKYLHQIGCNFLRGHCPDYPDYNEEIMIKLKYFSGSETDIEEETISWINENIYPLLQLNDKELKRNIMSNIWEIIQNSLTHSENSNGISVCGQLYPKKKYFELALYDFGIGIPNKIKSTKLKLKESEYIKWSMGRGNSTKNIPNAGMGLYFLRKFIKMNSGYFQVISNNEFFGHIHSTNEETTNIKSFFDGTLINLRINY
ncbi:MAG: ATP-binding protein [Melioribacteraceae bacterium]